MASSCSTIKYIKTGNSNLLPKMAGVPNQITTIINDTLRRGALYTDMMYISIELFSITFVISQFRGSWVNVLGLRDSIFHSGTWTRTFHALSLNYDASIFKSLIKANFCLEFATDQKAHVVGKPSEQFFHLALKGNLSYSNVSLT